MAFRFSRRTDADPAGSPTPDNSDAGDEEMDGYLAALAPQSDATAPGAGRVLQIRLDGAATDTLHELASARGTSPQALAKEWVTERLSWESRPPAD